MTDVPAFCNNCGYIFHSGFAIGPNSVVSDCLTKCPKCGNAVDVNATTDSKGNLQLFSKTAFRVLTGVAVPTQDLDKFKSIIKNNTKERTDKSEFIETIRQELPELDEITNLLVPTNAGEFYSFLSFLLALITFVILMRGSSKEPSPTIINNFYGAKDPEGEAYKAAYEQSGIKRKDTCPCGSGKKFKNCHGV